MKVLHNKVLIIFILSSIGCAYAAEKNMSIIDTIKQVVLGDKQPTKTIFLMNPHSSPVFEMISFSEMPLKKIPFTALHQELQNKIMGYWSVGIDDSDIIASAQVITSLAQVNKEFNRKINDCLFTQILIKNFYEKFAGIGYIMPYAFKCNFFIMHKGSQKCIPESNHNNIGYHSVAILLKTQGAVQWLQKDENFRALVEKEKRPHSLLPYNVRFPGIMR